MKNDSFIDFIQMFSVLSGVTVPCLLICLYLINSSCVIDRIVENMCLFSEEHADVRTVEPKLKQMLYLRRF